MERLETEFATYAHLGMIVESRNAKFLEYDLVSGSDQFRNIVSDIDHISINLPLQVIDCLLFITPSSSNGVERTIVEVKPLLKFHKLLTTFQEIKLIELHDTSNNKLNLILPRRYWCNLKKVYSN
ncbi:hypothetical protein AAG906_026697 [Vitis piasezkii]